MKREAKWTIFAQQSQRVCSVSPPVLLSPFPHPVCCTVERTAFCLGSASRVSISRQTEIPHMSAAHNYLNFTFKTIWLSVAFLQHNIWRVHGANRVTMHVTGPVNVLTASVCAGKTRSRGRCNSADTTQCDHLPSLCTHPTHNAPQRASFRSLNLEQLVAIWTYE